MDVLIIFVCFMCGVLVDHHAYGFATFFGLIAICSSIRTRKYYETR